LRPVILSGPVPPVWEKTLSSEDLKPRVKELIVRQLKLDLDPASIKDDAPLFGDADGGLGLDSIDALELVLGVEKEFGIKVQDEEVGVKAFASVDALCEFIRSKAA
jgi:acyl carrier protein